MNKQELLQELSSRLASGELTRSEVLEAIDAEQSRPAPGKSKAAAALSTVLYYIGGGVVFLGMIFLIAQEWDRFGSGMRIFVTLGSGIAAFVMGVLFNGQERLGAAGPAFFLVAALLLPLGLLVTYDEAGIDVDRITIQMQIAGILFAAYFGAYAAMRNNVLLAFSFIFGTWLFFAVTDYMISGAPMIDDWSFINYRILFTGLTFMLLGYSFVGTEREPLTGWLYVFGVFGFLGAGFALGEWKPNQNVFWEAVYPGLVFGIIFLSTYLKSRIFLIFGSIALGAYLTKITAEYFSDSLGWAFSLVLVGFFLMGVAYLAVRVNRKHIS
ncbi:MAG: hypothetical protein OER91_14500 [Gammaproteobacteria bacterium]|nr:hypothetical protein [Gammaproteobacteria bacterium]